MGNKRGKRGGAGAPWVFDGPYDPYRQLLCCMDKLKFCVMRALEEAGSDARDPHVVQLSVIEMKLRHVEQAIIKCPEIAAEYAKLDMKYPFERIQGRQPIEN